MSTESGTVVNTTILWLQITECVSQIKSGEFRLRSKLFADHIESRLRRRGAPGHWTPVDTRYSQEDLQAIKSVLSGEVIPTMPSLDDQRRYIQYLITKINEGTFTDRQKTRAAASDKAYSTLDPTSSKIDKDESELLCTSLEEMVEEASKSA